MRWAGWYTDTRAGMWLAGMSGPAGCVVLRVGDAVWQPDAEDGEHAGIKLGRALGSVKKLGLFCQVQKTKPHDQPAPKGIDTPPVFG